MKKTLIYILLTGVLQLAAQDFSVEIAAWRGGKSGAVSVSFDDASYTQYEYAFPVLEKYGLTASFSLVGEWTRDTASYSAEPGMFQIKKMGWREIRELSARGYEIAAHGYHHVRYGKHLPADTLAKSMKRIKSLIEKHIAKPVYTMHYPYSFTSDNIVEGAKRAGYILGRAGGQDYNTYENFNPYLLKSQAVLNDTIPNTTDFQNIIKQAEGKWLILMYHHLFPADSKEMQILKHHKVLHTYSVFPATFDRQMKMVAASGYWVDTEANTGRYMIERQHTKIRFKKFCNTLIIRTKTDLDTKIFNVPLTLSVKVPWQKVKVKGGIKPGIYEVKNGQLFIDILPGKTLIIKKIM